VIDSTLSLLRPLIRELEAYRSARSLGIKGEVFLDANESPWSSVPADLNRYPEPQPKKVLKALASLYEVSPEQLLLTRGADEAIDILVRAFCEAGRDAILICPPTYGVYKVAADIQGAETVTVPLREENEFSIEVEAVLEKVTKATKLVFLCSPNNPTGNVVPVEKIEKLASQLEGRSVLVIDEAYIEFASCSSFTKRLNRFSNVVVLRTLSKAWALAGARLGVAIAHPKLVDILQKVRAPYPISSPVAGLVAKAIDERGRASCQSRIDRLIEQRQKLFEGLSQCEIVEKIFPSEANFLLVKTRDSKEFLSRCLARGIVVRDRSLERGLANCVRITVGSEEENQALLDAVKGRPIEADKKRRATVSRATNETSITASVNLDGRGQAQVDTGIKYFDHMLEQISKHGGFDLSLQARGDLDVDEHHTVEDTALVLGECLNQALGDRVGIGRYGFLLPMDESEAKVSLDLSGRAYLVFKGEFFRESVGGLPTELVPHFFRSLSDALRATLHIEVSGENAHHMVEACFKAVGRSLRQAIKQSAGEGLPSTKGIL
jgi:histidinol-phosphate aminotransferase